MSFLAQTDSAITASYATATTVGLTGNLYAVAGSNKNVNAVVNTDPGSHITAQSVSAVANVPRNQPNNYIRDPQCNANTVVHYVEEVVDVVVEVVMEVVSLWGLLFNPTPVTEQVDEWVAEITGATSSTTYPGSQSMTNSVNFNTNISITGLADPILVVNSSGEVEEMSGVTATDGVNPLSVGETIGTNQIVVNNILNPSVRS